MTQLLKDSRDIPLGPSKETPCRFTYGLLSVCLLTILFHAYLLLGKSGLNRTWTSGSQQQSLRPWRSPGLAWPSQDLPGSWKPAFMVLSFTLVASLASLASDLESWVFARTSLASLAAYLAFARAFFLRRIFDLALVPSSRDRPALAATCHNGFLGCIDFLLGLVVVFEVTMLLDCIQYRRHMHQEGFPGPVLVPHRKVESGIYLDSGLDFKVSQFCNLFLDLILRRHIGDRRQLT